jgi:hypothetical protein
MMASGIGMEDTVFYAKVGPENLKKLGASSEAAIFQMIFKDTMANMPTYYSELREIDGFGAWMINEAIGSLIGGGYITTNPKEAYVSSSSSLSNVPAAVTAANEAVPSVGVPAVNNQYSSPPDMLIPGGTSSASLSPEVANAIGVDYSQETVNYHAKKDAKKEKKGNVMNLMDGLSTGRLIDHIGDSNEFGKSMENVGGGMGTMMEGLSLKMPSVPLDGRRMKGAYEDEDEDR